MIANRTRIVRIYGRSWSHPTLSLRKKLLLLALATLGIVGGMLLGAITVRAASTQDDLRTLSQNIEKAITQLQAGDKTGAETAYNKFDAGWPNLEDEVKAQLLPAYNAIEDAMGEVKIAFNLQPFEATRALEALKKLEQVNFGFITGGAGQSQPNTTATTAAATTPTFKALVEYLDSASSAIAANKLEQANLALKDFQREWPSLETYVAAKSATTYSAIENNVARVYAQLESSPPDLDGAKTTLSQLKNALTPYLESNNYGIFEATTVLLREGLEALLVIAALLAFLSRSGNADKRKLIWTGAGLGIGASLVVAIIMQVAFSGAASAGTNREVLEGTTGLVAAAMLFYMSYWLHNKSNMNSWQHYIKSKSGAALATGSAFSLGLLAFLAVFREGAETALLYMGIASSISLSDLLIGLTIGLVTLLALAVLILVIGMKLPLRPFFLIASILIYYVGFKFIGTGIHALQVAGVLPATSPGYLPESSFLGIYPTWETTAAQLALLIISAGVLVWTQTSNRKLTQSSVQETTTTSEANAA
ncbi:MAG: FTR1 family protein [Chloroflexota bacterium]